MNSTVTAPTFEGHTAEEWQQKAADFDRYELARLVLRRQVSRVAEEAVGFRYAECVTVAENGGTFVMAAFADLETGEIIKGRWIETRYGSAWAPADKSRGLMFPSSARNEAVRDRNNARKGFRQVSVRVPAKLNHSTYEIYADVNGEWVEESK